MSNESQLNRGAAGALSPAVAGHKGVLPLPMDMTALYTYEALISDIIRINGLNGPLYMQELLLGKNLAEGFLGQLLFELEGARNATKEAYAIAYLEKSEDYIKLKNLKPTDETKKQYVQIDPDYKKAKDREDMLKALFTMMQNKADSLTRAHDDARAIYKGATEARGSSHAIPQGKDSA